MLNNKFLYTFSLICLLVICSYCKSPSTDNAMDKSQFCGIKRIVIDPGFGGKEIGAPGCIKGVYSKDINLHIAKKLAKNIHIDLGLETIMTRDSDKFISLEDRVALANNKSGDLFISIQCNSDRNRRIFGIETFCLGATTDFRLLKNSFSKKSDLQTILSNIKLNANQKESCHLADYVQKSLYEYMSKKYDRIKNRGVKNAPFVVLMGTEMPSIVIEVSFISNPIECKRLISEDYQNELSIAISNGIRRYIWEQ